jgi:mitotic spindle assembly checkpoint protein MAD2
MSSEKNVITLRGSAKLVTEFFGYSVHSILFQRGIYDSDLFEPVKQYGVPVQLLTDKALKAYVDDILRQLEAWLMNGQVQKLVLVVTNCDNRETIERWVFDVRTEQKAFKEGKGEKSEKEIRSEMGAIIRQITSCVTFLPLIECPCTFDLLVYTPSGCLIPPTWEESDPRYIAKSNQVRLRSFSTSIHTVEASVAFKVED